MMRKMNRSQIVTGSKPYAYTEQSITMLSNREMFAHLDRVELRQLETDKKLEEVFDYIATTKEMNKNSLDNG